MTSPEDVRWEQRYRNFDRALRLLREAVEKGPEALNPLEQEGAVHRFEYCFELAWKTLKDYLESDGVIVEPLTPRRVIKAAFAARLIPDGQTWIEMLDYRNLLSHTYDHAVFTDAVQAVGGRYLPALERAHRILGEKRTSP
jgi:nucleotidyltransferase substrate binding protein (TIGR01987 family)